MTRILCSRNLENNVNTKGLSRSNDAETGQAYIFVESTGDSMISILPGANAELSPSILEKILIYFLMSNTVLFKLKFQ